MDALAQSRQYIVLLLIFAVMIACCLIYGAMLKRYEKTNKVFWLKMSKWFSRICNSTLIVIIAAAVVIFLLTVVLLAVFPFVYKS